MPLVDELSGQAIDLIWALLFFSLFPVLLMCCTCFTYILICLGILRHAIGLPTAPPNILILLLSFFMTILVMEPFLGVAWRSEIVPYLNGEDEFLATLEGIWPDLKAFMILRIDQTVLLEIENLTKRADSEVESHEAFIFIPAFVISEVSAAFQVGFILFLPFLIIDLAVAAILMSMGMMMVPPAVISLPFKLAFFVIVDGWSLIISGLVVGY